MKKKLIGVWVLFFILGNTYTQSFNLVNRYGLANLILENVQEHQNRFYFSGHGNDSIEPSAGNYFFLKTDFKGNEILVKKFRPDSNFYYYSTPKGLHLKADKVYHFVRALGLVSPITYYRNAVFVTDTNGILLNYKLYADTTYAFEGLKAAQPTSDNGFLMVGRLSNNNQGDVYYMKLDSNLNLIWRKTFGNIIYDEEPKSIIPISNNRFLIGGVQASGTNSQTFILMIDSLGNILKQFIDPNQKTGAANDIAYLPDSSGFVYCGYDVVAVNSSTLASIKSLKCIDTTLNSLKWIGNIPENRPEGTFYEMRVTNKIIVMGFERGSLSIDPVIRPLMGTLAFFDFDGNTLHYNYFEGLQSTQQKDSESYLYSMDLLPNGEILAAGRTENNGPIEGWIMKLDSNGCLNDSCPPKGGITKTKIKLVSHYGPKNYFSQQAFFSLGMFNNYPDIYYYNDIMQNDTINYNIGYDLSGIWQPFSSARKDTFYLDSLPVGNFTLTINTLVKDTTATTPYKDSLFSTKHLSIEVRNVDELSRQYQNFKIVPNPFNEKLQIDSENSFSEIQLFDVFGKLVFQKTKPTKQLDLGFLPNGIYLLKLKFETGEWVTQKVVKY